MIQKTVKYAVFCVLTIILVGFLGVGFKVGGGGEG